MLTSINKIKVTDIDSSELDIKWTTFNIADCIPNLKPTNYDAILRAFGWKQENSVVDSVRRVDIRACAVNREDGFIIFVGGYMSDVVAYNYIQRLDALSEDLVLVKLAELLNAMAAKNDSRGGLAWSSLVSYFERKVGFEESKLDTLYFKHRSQAIASKTTDFPVIRKMNYISTAEHEVPAVNQIDFEDKVREAFGLNLGLTIEAYFIQQMVIASNYMESAEDKNITFRYLEVKEPITNTTAHYLGMEYTLPGNPKPIEIGLYIDQTVVDLNTGKLNKMSEIILRNV